MGDVGVLREYEEDRYRSNALMLTAVDGLKRVWSTSFVPLATLRNVGLKMTDHFTPLKVALFPSSTVHKISVSSRRRRPVFCDRER